MIRILNPGIYSTIQDSGRKGFANIGVPISGAMDMYSARLGNHLLHNNEAAAVLEITFGMCKIQFEKEVVICITGADFTPKVGNENVQMNTVFKLKKGTVLSFGKRIYGVRTYICVQHGFQTASVLKSKSFYKGVTSFESLKKGDILRTKPDKTAIEITHAKIKINKNHFTTKIIECIKGPEFELLDESQQILLLSSIFTISKDTNRVGYRLEELLENNLKPIVTSGVLPGTVQLTPSGKLIVLMRDCQVTGGYPRVLQLTEKSINQLAQKWGLDEVQFQIQKP